MSAQLTLSTISRALVSDTLDEDANTDAETGGAFMEGLIAQLSAVGSLVSRITAQRATDASQFESSLARQIAWLYKTSEQHSLRNRFMLKADLLCIISCAASQDQI